MLSKKLLKILVLIICVICIVIMSSIYYSSNTLLVTHYTINNIGSESIRIIQLTDLHNKEFGKDNNQLIDKIATQKPDLIFMTGDMLNKDEENTDIIISLIQELSKLATVYYGYGNHEIEWEETYHKDLKNILMSAGANVLNNEYKDITIKGHDIRIGGYYGYYRQPGMTTKDENQKKIELEFADDFENTNKLKILLCHIPTTWLDWQYRDKYPIDLVFSGHYHGGQIRIPFIGGLYAPYVGFFPKYTKGIFKGKTSTTILSTGLASEGFIPRINNPAEIVVLDLK